MWGIFFFLALVLLSGCAGAPSDTSNLFHGGYEGRWEGLLTVVPPDDAPLVGTPETIQQFHVLLEINAESARVWVAEEDSESSDLVEIGAGQFKFIRYYTNAILYAFYTAETEDGVSRETSSFTLTKPDADRIYTYWAAGAAEALVDANAKPGTWELTAQGTLTRVE